MRTRHYLHQPDHNEAFPLSRRGNDLGWVSPSPAALPTQANDCRQQWQQMKPCRSPASSHNHHQPSTPLPPSQLLLPPSDDFGLSAISAEEHDQQAIEKLYFQGYDGEEAIGEVWCKISWLSFYDEDASLRFRFSFGTEGIEHVAADPARQQLAAKLCQQCFPESSAITDNQPLLDLLQTTLKVNDIAFVERIIYFNAPNGGALFHHDVEQGHLGVIYAQISGSSCWLALSKQQLIREIEHFSVKHHIELPFVDSESIASELNKAEHPQLEAIIDHDPRFIHQLMTRGYGYILHAGDALLLAQDNEESCVWHSVFCLGDEPGEGLSFAMRATTPDPARKTDA